MADHPTVDETVQAIMLALDPIAKGQRSAGQNAYQYRGRDAITNAVAPLMAEHGLKVIPVEVEDLTSSWHETGRKQPERLVGATYTFEVRGPGGDSFRMKVYGETMNSRDKSAGGVLSYAWRFGVEALFCIPTEAADPEQRSDDHHADAPSDDQPQDLGPPIDAKHAADLVAMMNSIEDEAERKQVKDEFWKVFRFPPATLPKGLHAKALKWVGGKVPEPFDPETGERLGLAASPTGEGPGDEATARGSDDPAEAVDLLQFMLLLDEEQMGKVQETFEDLGYWPVEDQDDTKHAAMLAVAQAAIE